MVNSCAVCGCCTRTDIVREHLEDTLRICDVSAKGLFKVSNQKLSSVINCSSKNGVRININNCEYYALINKCNIFYRELMM